MKSIFKLLIVPGHLPRRDRDLAWLVQLFQYQRQPRE